MPPTSQADRVTQPGQPHLTGQADRILLRRPQGIIRNGPLDPKPVPARRGVPGPVQPRMIRQNLHAGADDEDHEKQVEEVLQIYPGRKPDRPRRRRRHVSPRVAPDEALHKRVTAQTLGDSDQDDQQKEADRQQPQQVEPSAAPDPHARRDPVDLRHRPRPRGGVDHILTRRQLIAVAAYNVRRDTRPLICRRIPRRVVGIRFHSPAAYAVKHQRQGIRPAALVSRLRAMPALGGVAAAGASLA